ncbi:MAG TPA: cation transporting ATPase C-terminal domain-containing protein [Patescibacteria group bacterium]|nr:cation transporting ATPase C-terminal domain-containing protein [Patescibacteria group bacterium]
MPILPVQILLTSLLTDLPCITIASDNVDPNDLLRPKKFNVHSLMFISIFLGSITAVFEIMYFALIKNQSHLVVSTSLYLFITYTSLIVILSVRSKRHFWQAPIFSSLMRYSFILIAILSLLLIYFPKTMELLSFEKISMHILGLTIVMTIMYLFVLDIVKTWFYKTNFVEGRN